MSGWERILGGIEYRRGCIPSDGWAAGRKNPTRKELGGKAYRGKPMREQMEYFIFSEKGTTSVEYALMVGSIFLGIVLAVSDLGVGILNLFQSVANNYPQ
jgi:Flp pilus assembly pilin Flp